MKATIKNGIIKLANEFWVHFAWPGIVLVCVFVGTYIVPDLANSFQHGLIVLPVAIPAEWNGPIFGAIVAIGITLRNMKVARNNANDGTTPSDTISTSTSTDAVASNPEV